MFKFPRFKDGDSVPPPRWFNEVGAALEWISKLSAIPPLTYSDERSGPVIGAQALRLGGRIAKTGAGGIPGAQFGSTTITFGSATCRMYNVAATTPLSAAEAENDTVYTMTTAVAPNMFILCLPVDGRWFVVLELCPA